MLRNPVDMMYSLHSEFLYNGNEDIVDFEKALEAEDERKKGLRLPKNCRLKELLFYRDVASYAGQVKRYLDVFGKEKVHVIIFDDFKKDTPGVYRKTLSFLEVDENFQPEFKIVNPNKHIRSIFLRDFIMFPYKPVRRIVKTLIPNPSLRQSIKKRIEKIYMEYKPRPPMNLELRKRLQKEFLPEIERLSELLGRDLTFWCKGGD